MGTCRLIRCRSQLVGQMIKETKSQVLTTQKFNHKVCKSLQKKSLSTLRHLLLDLIQVKTQTSNHQWLLQTSLGASLDKLTPKRSDRDSPLSIKRNPKKSSLKLEKNPRKKRSFKMTQLTLQVQTLWLILITKRPENLRHQI